MSNLLEEYNSTTIAILPILRTHMQILCWLVCWLCLTSHRQRGHLETASPFTVPCKGREARFLHQKHNNLIGLINLVNLAWGWQTLPWSLSSQTSSANQISAHHNALRCPPLPTAGHRWIDTLQSTSSLVQGGPEDSGNLASL